MLFNIYPYLNVNDLNLDFILKHVKALIVAVNDLDDWKTAHESEYAALKKSVDDLENGNWSPEFVTTLINWYHDNIVDIIGEMVKQVFFGINDEGYFVAYIPESWNDILFGTTGLDDFPVGIEYGHLTLSY